MKILTLFDILQDAQDLLSYFENVSNKDQMVSRLERLKHQFPEELYDTIESLRVSTNTALEDQLELGGALTDGNEPQDNLLDELETINYDNNPTVPEISEPGLTNPTSEVELKEKVST